MKLNSDQTKNQIECVGVIILTNKNYCLVSTEDFEKVNGYIWQEKKEKRRKTNYVAAYVACNNIQTRKSLHKKILMHRLILNAKPKEQVDHINHNGLDNRRCNIRIATHAQNIQNQFKPNLKKKCKFHSSYKGVSWHHIGKCWRSRLKDKHLGLFDSEVEAAKAYDKYAKEIYGEFAFLNFK